MIYATCHPELVRRRNLNEVWFQDLKTFEMLK